MFLLLTQSKILTLAFWHIYGSITSTMVAKAIMILFPIGVILSLGYISVHFFAPVPKEVTAVEAAVTPNFTPLMVPDYATNSPESEFISLVTSSSTEIATSTPGVSVETKPITTQVVKKAVSSSLLRSGLLGDSWASNSWGASIAYQRKTESLGVFFHSAWEALSLYSSGYSPTTYRSLEIVLTSTSLDPHTLFVTAYNDNRKLGGVPLYPYAVNETGKIYRIPLEDVLGTSTRLTQITLESDRPQVVFVSEINFSKIVERSRLEEIRDKEKVVPPAIVPTPEITPIPTETTVIPKIRSAATVNPNVYFGGLQSGWKTVVRRGAIIDLPEDENQSVTGKAIKMHFTKQDGSISFEREGGIATKNFVNLHLKVFAGTTDYQWQQLVVTLYDIDGNKLGTRDIMTYSGNGKLLMQNWNKAIIPLRELGASDTIVGTIDIENVSVTQEGDYIWIDDVRFLDENS